jgi:pimeloyl-ACP methyl ester carboxylesterase
MRYRPSKPHGAPMQRSKRSYYVTVTDGSRLYARRYFSPSPSVAGRSPRTVLLLHGLSSSSKYFECLQSELQQVGYGSISFDLRGHGRSSKDRELDYGPERVLYDAFEVCRAFGVERPLLCGVSLGSIVALAWACGYVARAPPIAGLMLISCSPRAFNLAFPEPITPNIGLTPKALAKLVGRDVRGFGLLAETDMCVRDESYAGLMRRLDRATDEASLAALERMLLHAPFVDLAHRLDAVAVPTLVVHGGRDEIFPFDAAVYLFQHLADAQLVGDPNRGHSLLVTDPAFVHRAILNFLGSRCEPCVAT